MSHCQLLYMSYATSLFDESTLLDIRRSASAFNCSNGITGALCYAYGKFVQVLEGPPVETNQLYAKILADRRHERAMLLNYVSHTKPVFTTWSMKIVSLDEKSSKESALLVQYSNYKSFKPEEWEAERVLSFLSEVVRILPSVDERK